jgi:hypothetical protein
MNSIKISNTIPIKDIYKLKETLGVSSYDSMLYDINTYELTLVTDTEIDSQYVSGIIEAVNNLQITNIKSINMSIINNNISSTIGNTLISTYVSDIPFSDYKGCNIEYTGTVNSVIIIIKEIPSIIGASNGSSSGNLFIPNILEFNNVPERYTVTLCMSGNFYIIQASLEYLEI